MKRILTLVDDVYEDLELCIQADTGRPNETVPISPSTAMALLRARWIPASS